MGRVQSSLVLNDQMSRVLTRINKAMGLVLDSFEAVQRASGKSFNTENIASARREIGAANAALKEMEESYRDCDNRQQQLNKHIKEGTTATNGLLGKVKNIASAYLGMKSVKELVDLSDTVTQNNARLSMMNDGKQSNEELSNLIYASAQRSRGSYLGTADAVAKLGLMAGDAFSSNKETIAFMEQINKQFKIAGITEQGIDAAMLQLTQAMGSGVLRGEEFNSVLEQAPNIIQSIADYMGVAKGDLKDMAAKGKITADIVKNAMFAAAEDTYDEFGNLIKGTNSLFESMPMTWADVWTSIENQAIKALDPVLVKINELANSESVQSTVDGLVDNFSALVSILAAVFDGACSIYNFIVSNWGVISPIIGGIVAAFAAYNAVLLVHKGILLAQSAIKAIQTVREYAHAKSILSQAAAHGINTKAVIAEAASHEKNTVALTKESAALTGEAAASGLAAAGLTAEEVATAGATVAQNGFNTALLACPLTWILIAVIAVIVAVYAIVAAVNNAKDTTVSATGIIFGAVCTVGAAIWNIIVGLLNGIMQYFCTYFVEPWIGIVEWILNVCNGGFNSFGDAVKNLIGNIISWFLSLGEVVTKIIDAIFNTNWSAELESLKGKVLAWGKNDNAITFSREAPTLQTITGGKVDRWAYSDAWNTGYNAGEKVESKVKSFLNPEYENIGNFDGLFGDIAKNTGDTAKNTGKTTEELSYLRDIAEREAINRFTTAEIKVDMSGMNNRIDSNMDLDGIISYLTDGVAEALVTASEGVY